MSKSRKIPASVRDREDKRNSGQGRIKEVVMLIPRRLLIPCKDDEAIRQHLASQGIEISSLVMRQISDRVERNQRRAA